MRRIGLLSLVALVLAVAVGLGLRVTSAQSQRVALADAVADTGQWVMPGQNYANLRHSALDEIKADNVGGLKAAWTMSTGATRGHEVLETVPRPVAASTAAGITATPGSSFPSSSSSEAPPPVDAHETRSVSPSSLSALIESAPPTTEKASAAATASATALVPSA